MVMPKDVHWLGHASIKITGSKTIYIDPWKLKKPVPADIILVTHDHYDHCSPNDIEKIRGEKTVVVSPMDSAVKLKSKVVKPGDIINIDGITIKAVPAYNTNKQFHPKSNNWVGYLVTIDGRTIYHTGDTDAIPEMEGLKPNIAFFPVSGTYTMTAKEAADIANKLQPDVAVPMHYGDIIGSRKDAEKFKELCKCKVSIMEAE